MVSYRCKMLVKAELEKLGLYCKLVNLGEVEIEETITAEQKYLLKNALLQSGLELRDDKNSMLIEKNKTVKWKWCIMKWNIQNLKIRTITVQNLTIIILT